MNHVIAKSTDGFNCLLDVMLSDPIVHLGSMPCQCHENNLLLSEFESLSECHVYDSDGVMHTLDKTEITRIALDIRKHYGI